MKAFHWDLTAFSIPTHHCAVAEIKKIETNSLGLVAE